ncbi:putative transcription factor/ chromatin remodeling BED-type(Zn) family [Helianthus annuus]|uniref:uncharacterized protein LOC110925858 n=1 Tax=Helianthus annuus TaxID=4232 RepID=UPI000B8F43C9|nr:uncharacterized protein LOC110925858 [Helianthus annuus]KAJ0828363.1 putative transcription factor/ chromatin remodeling BED-type(Zn) family [Helianthus annuus]
MSFGPNKARCVHCGAMLKSDSNTTLKKHLSTYCKLLRNDPNQGQPPLSSDGKIWHYDVESVRGGFGNFVIQQGLPFQFFDNQRLTRLIQRVLQPRYNQDYLDAAERIQHVESLEDENGVETDIHEEEVEMGMSSPLEED